MADPKRKPKMIQAWKREPLSNRLVASLQLLYVHGTMTTREAQRIRRRLVKVIEQGGEFCG